MSLEEWSERWNIAHYEDGGRQSPVKHHKTVSKQKIKEANSPLELPERNVGYLTPVVHLSETHVIHLYLVF